MQTWLPSPDFEETASILDHQRLGQQRLETFWIMQTLISGRGATLDPAVQMWRGYEYSLLEYQVAMCTEWHIYRGFNDEGCLRRTMDLFWTAPYLALDVSEPWWLGNDDFHWRHQSNLLRIDPECYGDFVFDKDLPDNLEFLWPV